MACYSRTCCIGSWHMGTQNRFACEAAISASVDRGCVGRWRAFNIHWAERGSAWTRPFCVREQTPAGRSIRLRAREACSLDLNQSSHAWWDLDRPVSGSAKAGTQTTLTDLGMPCANRGVSLLGVPRGAFMCVVLFLCSSFPCIWLAEQGICGCAPGRPSGTW